MQISLSQSYRLPNGEIIGPGTVELPPRIAKLLAPFEERRHTLRDPLAAREVAIARVREDLARERRRQSPSGAPIY